MAKYATISQISDVAAASASRQRQAQRSDDIQFINISEAALSATPNLKARFIDVLNSCEDFRAAMDTSLRHAKRVPDGHSVHFTRTKRGWLIVIGPERAASSGAALGLIDVE